MGSFRESADVCVRYSSSIVTVSGSMRSLDEGPTAHRAGLDFLTFQPFFIVASHLLQGQPAPINLH